MSWEVDELADRIRARIGDRPNVREQKMFGAIAFMLDGNMLVAPMKGGALLCRVGKDAYNEALKLPGAAPMVMKGRTMSGFVQVSGDVLESEDALNDWIARAERFVATLPAK